MVVGGAVERKSMNLIIKETGETRILRMVSAETGCDYAADFVGNSGATSDGQLVWDDERQGYLCDQATADWWVKVCADTEAVHWRIARLIKMHKHDAEDVYRVVNDAAVGDIETDPATIGKALDQEFGAAVPRA